MNILSKLDYGTSILLDTIPVDANHQLHIKLEKTYHEATNSDYYFIRLFIVGDSFYKSIGYMYFYLNQVYEGISASTYIGTYINPEYRSYGLATLLLSSWISLTRENNCDTLTTIKRQRKPFILYLLKKYGFDIADINEYLSATDKIYICARPNDETKYLLFQSLQQRLDFMYESVYRRDNYEIIPTNPENKPWDVSILDTVLLNRIHNLVNFDKSYNLARKKLCKVKIEGIEMNKSTR